MSQKSKQSHPASTDGICRNDRTIQSTCTTVHKAVQKVKGKSVFPAEPPLERWQ